jgi:hypothetical protein
MMPRKTIELWDTGFLVPPHTRGDREFDGHGPQIWIDTRIYVSELRKIKARIWMRFVENRSDWTTAEGTFTVDVYDGTYDNVERINYVVSPGTSSDMYYEQAGGHGGFTRPEDAGPVNEYYIVGDTRGSEAGTQTGASIRFRPVTIDFVEPAEGNGTADVNADVVHYIPPHTRGDRDFGGHGPRVWCNVQVRVRNQTEIWAEVYMKAQETQQDWTTAEGTETFRVYTHDRPILDIVSDAFSDVYYQDHDHAEDVITLSGGELVKQFVFVGDTRGSEAGTRTGVVISFNPIKIRH